MVRDIPGIGERIDAVVAAGTGSDPSFRAMAAAARLDPATDFVGSDLSGCDFRDGDLSGFCFRDADLTGCDFRRASGLADDAFDGAGVAGCIGLPEAVEARRGADGRIEPAQAVPSPR